MPANSRFEEGCDFCSIAQGNDDSAEIVCEAPEWLAFFPQNPATPGHCLVIPRTHFRDLWSVGPDLSGELMTGCVNVGRAVQLALKPDGMNLITSAGSIAEQTVFHLHLHIVPRWKRDGFGPIWPPESKYEDADLVDVADRIRSECQKLRVG
jgi:histidine triad (HIT) family protein